MAAKEQDIWETLLPMEDVRSCAAAAGLAFRVDGKALLSTSRRRKNCWTRFAAFWLARRVKDCTFEEIARYFRMNHTTIVHGVKRADELCRAYPGYEDRLQEAWFYLTGGMPKAKGGRSIGR